MALGRLVELLPERQAVALRLRFYEKLPIRDLAIVLGTTELAAAGLIRAACQTLRQSLHQFFGHELLVMHTHDPPERPARVDEVIREYFAAVDAGRILTRESVIAAHPHLAAELAEFFDGLRLMQEVAITSAYNGDKGARITASAQRDRWRLVPRAAG